MKVICFSSHRFEKVFLDGANQGKHELQYLSEPLTVKTAALAQGNEAISIFVNDDASAPVLEILRQGGVKYLALRSAGYNHVDLVKAGQLGMKVAHVPAYSPYAVAEHTVALMLALNRKLVTSHHRIQDLNFSLDGLVGFDMNGKTVGILGTGKIGLVVAKILHGLGCNLLAYDQTENQEIVVKYGATYTDFQTLCRQSDIITLHLPLTSETRHLINGDSIAWMKRGVMLINTSRGALVRTKHVIEALKKGHIGYFGMDVYEEEGPLFFENHSDDILQDDVIARLMTFRNVLITGHQAFLTQEALQNIASVTMYNLDQWEQGFVSENELEALP